MVLGPALHVLRSHGEIRMQAVERAVAKPQGEESASSTGHGITGK